MIFPPGRLPTDRTWPYDDPTTSLEGTTMTTDDQPTPTVRANRARMRDARYIAGEVSGVPELQDLHGRRFSPRSWRATWERQGGAEWPWELRVTIQGPSVLKSGGLGEKVRSLVWQTADDPHAGDATHRELPDWMARELAPFSPAQDPWTALDAGSGEVTVARQGGPMPGLGTLHGFVSGE